VATICLEAILRDAQCGRRLTRDALALSNRRVTCPSQPLIYWIYETTENTTSPTIPRGQIWTCHQHTPWLAHGIAQATRVRLVGRPADGPSQLRLGGCDFSIAPKRNASRESGRSTFAADNTWPASPGSVIDGTSLLAVYTYVFSSLHGASSPQ
jgi:hypothetical protein